MEKHARKFYNYQYDSTARAYAQEAEPLRRPKPSTRPAKQPVKRKKVDFDFGVQMFLCGVTIFISAALYIGSYASLRIKQTELKRIKNEKIMVMNSITEMQAKVDDKLNLSVIEKRATEEFGMIKPYAYQTVYIELPDNSYTTYEKVK